MRDPFEAFCAAGKRAQAEAERWGGSTGWVSPETARLGLRCAPRLVEELCRSTAQAQVVCDLLRYVELSGNGKLARIILEGMLTLDDPDLRFLAVQTAGLACRSHPARRKILEPLLRALRDQDAGVRLAAAQCLGGRNWGEAAGRLSRILCRVAADEHEDVDVRFAAFQSAAFFGRAEVRRLARGLAVLPSDGPDRRLVEKAREALRTAWWADDPEGHPAED